jgi:beta-phosphoglucomutase-like phosphatase (HAD superfamily)
VLGVRAGLVAGMKVIGYAPLDRDAPQWADLGASVIRHMNELPVRLQELAAGGVT